MRELMEIRRANAQGGEIRFKSVPQGAATTVWSAVVAPANEIGGRFCEDCHVAAIDDTPGFAAGVRSYALDPVRADALWARSEAMVGERFTYA